MKTPPYKHILSIVAIMTMAFAASLMYGNGLARAEGADVANYLVPLTGTVDTGSDMVTFSGMVHINARKVPPNPVYPVDPSYVFSLNLANVQGTGEAGGYYTASGSAMYELATFPTSTLFIAYLHQASPTLTPTPPQSGPNSW